ncbi:MAG: hypothetical protein RLZZ546_615 [Bacteroidota bacterium]|jgi:hypothetical protein
MEFSSPQTGYSCEIPRSFSQPSTKVFKYNGSPISGILSQEKLDAEVTVFPNPASEILNVKIKTEILDDYWIMINDISGKLLEKRMIYNEASIHTLIEIKDFPIGEYNITISSKEGVVTKKFVKI